MLLVTFKVLERNQAQVLNDLLFNQSLSFALLATPELLKHFRGPFLRMSRQILPISTNSSS
jgi:hypothetical protein